jgi:hypothetical protein
MFLGITSVLAWARTRDGLTTLHLLSFSGLAAYALELPLHRLFVVTFATVAVVMRQVVEWAGVEGTDVGYQGVCESLPSLIAEVIVLRTSSDGFGSSCLFAFEARQPL